MAMLFINVNLLFCFLFFPNAFRHGVGAENQYVIVGDAMRIQPTDLFKPFFVDEKLTVQRIRLLLPPG
ncbi:MAG: hypothetical protein V8Q79_03400 [Christensenellales bacterium]